MSRVSWIVLVGLVAARSASPTPSDPPVSIAHDPLQCWPKDEFVLVKATVMPPDDIRTLKLYYRAEQHTYFYYVDMSVNALGQAVAVVPLPDNGTSGIVYFLESVSTGFTATRTEEQRVPVMTASQCREAAPDLLYFSGDQPNITVGATRAGATKIPPGFKPDGITKFIDSAGMVVTEGGSKLPYILGGVGGGAAAAALALVAGKSSETDPSLPPVGGITTSVGVITTTSVPNNTTTTSASNGGGGPTTTVPPNSTTTVPGPTTTTTPGPTTTSTPGPTTTTTPGPTTTSTSSTTTTTPGPTTTSTSSTTTTTPGPTTTTSVTTTTTSTSTTTTSAPSVSTTTTSADPGADVRVSKSSGSGTVGQILEYNVTVRNNGPGRATGIIMVDDLPSSVTPSSAGGAACRFDLARNQLLCSIGDLNNGASVTVNINVYPNSPGTITNSASAAGLEPDPNPSNNSASINTVISTPLRAFERGLVDLALQSSLETKSPEGSARGRVIVNGSDFRETDNTGARIFHVQGRRGTNRFEAHFEGGTRAGGIWRFDFSGTPGFVNGSLRAESGQVVTLDGRSVVFAVGAAGGPIRFTLELR